MCVREPPEGLRGCDAEVKRGFFLRAIEFLQAGEELGGGDGDERGAVAENSGEQTEADAGDDGEHEQRKPGDDTGENQGEEDQPAEEGFAGEGGAVECERREQAESERERDAGRGDEEAVYDGIPDGGVAEQLAIPVEGEMARGKAADAVAIEGIKDEDGDGQVDEGEDQRGVGGEERGARNRVGFGHLKDRRFSRRSVVKSKETVISRMQTEMAAPSGQS